MKNANSPSGVLRVGQSEYPCLIGKKGKTFRKREGDHRSPIGKWKLERLYFRPDKKLHPQAQLSCQPLQRHDGWCDAKGHGLYNRHVTLPFSASYENLWREDDAYDLVVSTNQNQIPRIQGGGSAIFLHVINKGTSGTEGCVALSEHHLRLVLSRCSRHTYLVI